MGFFSGDCLAPGAPDNQWAYCPSVPAAMIFCVFFLLSWITHVFQAFRHRQFFCTVICIGVLWEAAAYGFRVLSAKHPTQKGSYDASFLLVLLAPVCVNAFDYMIASRIVRRFLSGQNILGMSGFWMGKIFVCCDIVSFIVQIGGGLMTLSSNANTAKNGLHIVTGGVLFQQALIIFFACCTFSISRKLRASVTDNFLRKKVHRQIHALQGSLCFISYRIIFRIVQFSAKQGGSISKYIDTHEWTVYVFDAGPMLLAVCLINIWHPGQILRYKPKYDVEYDIPPQSYSMAPQYDINAEDRPMITPEPPMMNPMMNR